MRKLNCLLIAFAIFEVACENSFDEQSKNQITLSSKTIEVHFESNEHTINVTSPYSWIAESKNEWISLTCDNGIAGTEELRFVCDRNLEESERKGTIVIKNEDFGLATELYVTQKSFIPELVVDQSRSLSFTEKGGIDIIKVSSNFNYDVSDDASWISCYKVEEGVKVSVSASDVVNERTAKITIYSEKYNLSYDVGVSQGAFKPELSIDKEELYFDADGGSKLLNITTSIEYSISKSANWITCSKSGNSIKITAYASTVVEERYADVIISSDKYNVSKVVKVRQGAFEPYISISATELISEAEGGEQNITISTNCQYDYSANVDWIKFHKEGSYPDVLPNYNGLFPIYISPNYKTETRSGEITIYNTQYNISYIVKVTQKAFIPQFEIEDISILEFDYRGGEKYISVTANFEYEAIATEWITLEKNISGVKIIVSPNYIMQDRLSSIELYNKTYNISIGKIDIYQSSQPSNTTIEYTTSTNGIVTPYNSAAFNANIVSNIYENGKGVLTFDTHVRSIGSEAFANCPLTSITIPTTVTSIGENAFTGCDDLVRVDIFDLSAWCNIRFDGQSANPSSGARLYHNCLEVSNLTIPSNITSISQWAFFYCLSVESVTIPENITSIGGWAFYACDNLRTIYCKSANPPSIHYYELTSSGSFPRNSYMKIYVPRNSVEAYKSAKYWRNYANYIEGYDF